MSPSEAAEKIGCSPQQVRWLIRNGRIRAKKVKTADNQFGYVYSVPDSEVDRYKSTPQTTGRPRKPPSRKDRRKPGRV